MRRLLLKSLVSFGAGAIAAPWVHAQAPERILRFVIPYPAGGGGDVLVRTMVPQLSKNLGQTIVVDNKPGAALSIGARFVAASPPDGQTLLLSASGLITLPYFSPVDFQIQRDLAPVAPLYFQGLVITVRDELPIRTMADLMAYAKANPGKLNYGSAGIGSTGFLSWELLKQKAGVDIVHIPFKGSAEVNRAMIDGTIQVAMDGVAGSKKMVESGKVRAVAVTGDARELGLPDVPTVTETKAVPDYVFTYWLGVHAAAGTSAPVLERLSREINAVLRSEEIRASLTQLAIRPANLSPREFAARIAGEAQAMAALVKAAGLTAAR